MLELLILVTYSLLLYGFTQIITYSTLLDGFRSWYLKRAGYPKVGELYVQTQPNTPIEQPLVLKLIFKLISCWLCASFWSGILFSLIGLSPFKNIFISGITSVGILCIFKFILEKRN